MKAQMFVLEYGGGYIRAVVYINMVYIPELNLRQTEDEFFLTLRQIMREGYGTWLEKKAGGSVEGKYADKI